MIISDLNYLETTANESVQGGSYKVKKVYLDFTQYAAPVAVAIGGGKYSETEAEANVYQKAYINIYQ